MSGLVFLSRLRQGLGALQTSGAVTVSVDVESNGATQPAAAQVTLYGPGDVAGIDGAMIQRREPPPRSVGSAPNLLASVEFVRPDFPWMMSRSSSTPIAPWLCLAVLDESDAAIATRPGAPLPVLEANADELPPLTEIHAWAHVQVSDLEGDLATFVRARPDRVVSRIVCPRRLEPDRRYVACLIPTTAAGRKSGLGEPLADTAAEATAPAWTVGAGTVRLPVYDHWTFQTGPAGDFESVVERLRPHQLDASDAAWPLDVSAVAGAGAARAAMPVAIGGGPSPWTGRAADEAAARLTAWLEPALGGATVVAPPLYGNAVADGVANIGDLPQWMLDLNLDPRYRAVAGLGVRLVRENQDRLVAEAHRTIGPLQQANRLIAGAELASTVAQSALQRHFAADSREAAARALAMAHPASDRIFFYDDDDVSARAMAASSALGTDIIDPAFRRMLSTRAHQKSIGTAIADRAELPPPTPVAPSVLSGTLTLTTVRGRVKMPTTPYVIEGVTQPLADPVNVTVRLSPEAAAAKASEDEAFLEAIARMKPRASRRQPSSVAPKDPLPIAAHAQSLVNALEPGPVAIARIQRRVGGVAGSGLAPIAVAPDLPVPVSELLREIDPRFLVSGLGDVPAESVTILEVDHAFVASLLVGANHELIRELLWRGIAVHPQSTPLRQFWRSGVDDIAPLHEWKKELEKSSLVVPRTVLVIRSELVHRFPGANIYCAPMLASGRADLQRRVPPMFRNRPADDTCCLAFPLDAAAMRSGGDGRGYSLVIEEHSDAVRFGFDVAGAATPPSWRELSWPRVPVGRRHVSLTATAETPAPSPTQADDMTWSAATSADMAAISRQPPVRVAIHCAHLVPTP